MRLKTKTFADEHFSHVIEISLDKENLILYSSKSQSLNSSHRIPKTRASVRTFFLFQTLLAVRKPGLNHVNGPLQFVLSGPETDPRPQADALSIKQYCFLHKY
ncbi:CLUMA_CG017725, isoform A [Clunio marinus]|uniref:CLUMA_CG017725, isoform A n=1 Tax=Clunio marinus TaxID=568069 RepID=A0A1J1IWS0_9DIPT|nr:CLUMA_CG017725, isoform A [Clunio marinus]